MCSMGSVLVLIICLAPRLCLYLPLPLFSLASRGNLSSQFLSEQYDKSMAAMVRNVDHIHIGKFDVEAWCVPLPFPLDALEPGLVASCYLLNRFCDCVLCR
jgi:hypothetical protein